jgi:hypothetical protein
MAVIATTAKPGYKRGSIVVVGRAVIIVGRGRIRRIVGWVAIIRRRTGVIAAAAKANPDTDMDPRPGLGGKAQHQ